MVYNPFDYIKQVDDDEAKEIVVNLRKENKRFRIRKDYYMCYGDDWDEWREYLVVIEVLEKNDTLPISSSLPTFTYKCHYTMNEEDAVEFCKELRTIK